MGLRDLINFLTLGRKHTEERKLNPAALFLSTVS